MESIEWSLAKEDVFAASCLVIIVGVCKKYKPEITATEEAKELQSITPSEIR